MSKKPKKTDAEILSPPDEIAARSAALDVPKKPQIYITYEQAKALLESGVLDVVDEISLRMTGMVSEKITDEEERGEDLRKSSLIYQCVDAIRVAARNPVLHVRDGTNFFGQQKFTLLRSDEEAPEGGLYDRKKDHCAVAPWALKIEHILEGLERLRQCVEKYGLTSEAQKLSAAVTVIGQTLPQKLLPDGEQPTEVRDASGESATPEKEKGDSGPQPPQG